MYREDDHASTYTGDDRAMSVQGQQSSYPEQLRQMVTRYQQNPEELKSLLKNRAVLAIGAALGLALLTGQIRRKR